MQVLFGMYLAVLTQVSPPAAAGDPVLVGAGDIGECGSGPKGTADLLDLIPGTVFTAGDNAYPDGTAVELQRCYAPTWGRHLARTHPAAGNHDYRAPNASPYFAYFGAAAGPPLRGYYSYDIGAWHIIVMNSNCSEVGGCQAGSAQEKWLREDLAAHPGRCTAAIWHHPRFSSGTHGGSRLMQDAWKALLDAGADFVVNGHDHDYERFATQDSAGAATSRGIREFVAGTGGADLRSFSHPPVANSEVRNSATHGVLKFTLHATSYDWEFIPSDGAFTDSGSSPCHAASAAN